MKTIRILLSCVMVSLLTASGAWAGLLFPYNRLALKDLDQMNKLVQDKIQESRKSKGDKIVPLKEAMQAVYSRPNEDFMIEKISSQLRYELDENDAYEHVMEALVKEATGALKNPKAFQKVVQVTYAIFLENVIAEMRPHAMENYENKILKQIRDAKIEITKEAKDERALRMMKKVESPSDIAKTVLKEAEAEEAAKKKAAEKAAPKSDD